MSKLGIQLWSYASDELKLSFKERLEMSSKIGFETVEYDGSYQEIEKDELKKLLADLNLTLISAYVGLTKLDSSLEYLASVGVKHIICPSAPYNSHEEAMIIANKLNEFGEKCKPYGIKTGFHNHAHDFYIQNGKPIVDTIYDNTNPETVIIQLDVGHAVGGGVDPLDYFKRYAGRIQSVHIKESRAKEIITQPKSYYDKTPKWKFTFDENGKKVFEPAFYENKAREEMLATKMGEGIIDWNEIVKVAKEQYADVAFIIERELNYNNPKDRLACIKEDYEYIRNNVKNF